MLDARDPLGTRCRHLEQHIKKNARHKHMLLLVNKCDLVSSCTVCRLPPPLSKACFALYNCPVANVFCAACDCVMSASSCHVVHSQLETCLLVCLLAVWMLLHLSQTCQHCVLEECLVT